MSLTDLQVIQLINSLYAYPGTQPVVWNHLDDGTKDDGVYWAAKKVDGLWVIINRGSVTAQDFWRDFQGIPWSDRDLGPVELGFLQGAKDQAQEVAALVGDEPWMAAGHSLGAARACIQAALGVARGKPPLSVVVFGEPRPAYVQMANLLAAIPLRSYRNKTADGHDLVTDVPPAAPLAFVHAGECSDRPRALIDVNAEPTDPDDWTVFRWHHAQLYEAGILKLNPLGVTG